jgi:hypothetical protein
MASAPVVIGFDADGRHACPARRDTGMRAPHECYRAHHCGRQTVVPGRHAGQTPLRARGVMWHQFHPTSPPTVFQLQHTADDPMSAAFSCCGGAPWGMRGSLVNNCGDLVARMMPFSFSALTGTVIRLDSQQDK